LGNPPRQKTEQGRDDIRRDDDSAFFHGLEGAAGNGFLRPGQGKMAEPPAFIGLAGRRDEFRIFHPIRTNSRYEDALRCQFHGQCPAVAQEKGFFYRLTSRYRHYAAFERATFEQGKPTQLLMLTDKQIADFQKHYQTEAERFHILPPGIYPDRKYSQQPANSREIFRKKNGITEQQYLLLQVGSDFTRKGVDRSIEALASLPDSLRHNTLLYVVGQDKPRKFEALAEKRGVRSNVHFFSGRNDVSELMAAADLLLHPAYQEAAGIVLLEAITAGLPVLTTAVCGYAHYIVEANCGEAIVEPFRQETLNEILRKALTQSSLRQAWAENARHYAVRQSTLS
jgi:UDP-glucose:(heptosyl)LPS alpha-1,3-glucosyltransferase